MDNADLEAVLTSVRDFVRKEVVPLEREIDENDEVPEHVRRTARDMGLFGFAIPESYGGLGLSASEEVRLMFELGYTTPALRSMFGTNNGIAGHVLLEGGTEEQKQRWLPRLASGEVVASFALTEPDAGSSPGDLRTTARADGEDWVISGSKRYITNAPIADVFMVFARTVAADGTQPGISAFLVPPGRRGPLGRAA
ncbi:acyl-CoA dehydrogenase family protein [Nocardioides sp. TF02-7]|uniref:acyl-CoA dehydrogenase family protein n=1 Tax=Nocardioides sp. TF02-7 TaxID=2917724 RepID=UPI001F069FD1|nr:acyl-CoA dehydrogenase family protein [Nocardioides sp. TF02-7]UMG91289.1 acyl-CoA dehydrogenase family protein [Nocardioides sp. TF02-7]